MPDHPGLTHAFGGGVTDTVLHPLVLTALLVIIVLTFTLSRKYVAIPMIVGLLLVPQGQQIYIGGVHWLVDRIIVLAGLLRVVLVRSHSAYAMSGGRNAADRAFFSYAVIGAIAMVSRYGQSEAAINQFGIMIDVVGAYALMRGLISDEEDIYRIIKCLAAVTLVLGVFMLKEQVTLENAFGLLGGTRIVPEIREGKIRSQGPFQHSITAGVFAATLIPLFVLLWTNGRAKVIAVVGLIGSSVMTICSNSSTPLMTYAAGILGLLMWPARSKMRTLRWGLVLALIGLNFVMKAPVWFIISHIDLTGGSSGYHRAVLIDLFIRHFSDWWLIGTSNSGTWADDMWDQQNQFVNVGEGGGLACLVFFLAMISRNYARIGNARKAARDRKSEWLVWCLGSALFAHIVGFFGVNYFDQSKDGWFALLAMIPAATAPILMEERVETTASEGTLAEGEPVWMS